MKSNRRLMLKQGVKGVFKFKIQFTIILVLTFLASLILTVSTTTNRRLSSSYNSIVGTTQKFDSTWSLNAGKTQQKDDENNFIPILDTIGYDNSYVNVSGTTDVNIILNNKYGVTNYITKTTNTQSFYNAYKNYAFNAYKYYVKNKTDDNAANSYGYGFKITINDTFFNQFITDLITFENDDSSNWEQDNVSYLEKTAIGQYTLENEHWFDSYVYDENGDLKADYETVYDKLIAAKTTKSAQYLAYAFYAIESLTEQLCQTTYSAFSYLPNLSEDNVAQNLYEFIFGLNVPDSSVSDEDNSLWFATYKNEIDDVVSYQEDQKSDIENNYFLLGDDTFDQSLVENGFRGNTNFIVNSVKQTDDGYELTQTSTSMFFGNHNELLTFASTSWRDNKYYQNNIVKYLNVTQPSYPTASTLGGSDIKVDNFGWISPKYEGDSTIDFYQKTTDSTDLAQKGNILNVWTVRNVAYMAHQNLASEAAGYDLYIRKEILYNDASTQKKYRMLVLDSEQKTTFKILKGTMPTSTGEIAISEQFAKKNKVSLGQYIKIGNGLFHITAFAVDTYSFYPSADPLVPLPKSQTDCLIYASPETLVQLTTPASGETSISSEITQTFNFINTTKKSNLSTTQLKTIRNNYIMFTNPTLESMDVNASLFNSPNNSASTFYTFQLFMDSTYRFNWTLYHIVFDAYSTITYLTAALIGIVALASLIVCVRKTIQSNSKQIGILKALGSSSSSIATSYISYSLFIGFIAVPLGWICGTLLQIPMMNIFLNYFSIPYDSLFFDWMGVLIAFIGFGVVSAIAGYITAYIETNKPVLEITMNKKLWSTSKTIDWMKRTVFKNTSFSTKLSLQLASSGKKTIGLLVASVFISSLLISVGLSIPAVAINAKNVYFKNTKFRNSTTIADPMANSPLAKNAVTFWEGSDALDADYVTDNPISIDGTSTTGYYQNPNNYTASVANSALFPSLQYSKDTDSVNSFYENIMTGNTKMYDQIINAFATQLYIQEGISISIGSIEQIYAYALNGIELKDSEGNIILDKDSTDKERIAVAKATIGPLATLLPQIFKTLISGIGNIDDSLTWKEQLVSVIETFAPSFIKSYINTESRKEQFGLGYSAATYVPKEETLATVFSANTSNKGSVTVTGLDSSQNAYVMSQKLKDSVFFSDEEGAKVKAEIQLIINGQYDNQDIIIKDTDGSTFKHQGDIVYKGIKIWDDTTKVLTIPSANNKQADASYSMKSGGEYDNISTTYDAIKLYSGDTGSLEIIPGSTWAYNDTDYVKSNGGYITDESTMTQAERTILNQYGYEKVGDNYYLDPSTMLSNKFTYSKEYDLSSTTNSKITDSDYKDDGTFNYEKFDGVSDNAYMFGDFRYDESGNITNSYIRPYYEYKNLELYIPVKFALGTGFKEDSSMNSVAYDLTAKDSSNGKEFNSDQLIANYLTENLGSKDLSNVWYLDHIARVVSSDEVPDSVKNSWSTSNYSNDEQYIVVNAYDTRMSSIQSDDLTNVEPAIFDGNKATLSALTDGYYPWIALAHRNKAMINESQTNDVDTGDAKTVNLQSVGTFNSYGSSTIVIDSDIANILKKWSTSRSTAYDSSGFDESTLTTSDSTSFNLYETVDFNTRKESYDAVDSSYLKESDYAQYNPHQFYNTVLSNIDEPLAVTSSTSLISQFGKNGYSMIANADSDANVFETKKYTFLSEQIALLNQITAVAVEIAILIVVAVAVASALLIMLMGDIYIARYKRFIVMLRSFGYGNAKIMTYVLGTVTIFSLAVWILATAITWGGMAIAVNTLAKNGFAIPFGIQWWAPVLCIAIMLISYIGSLAVSSKAARKEPVAYMMSSTVE